MTTFAVKTDSYNIYYKFCLCKYFGSEVCHVPCNDHVFHRSLNISLNKVLFKS